MASAEIAVIGGSGFYRWLDGADEVTPSTPYGPLRGPSRWATVGGRAVAFLARHGSRHEVPPHAVNGRANLWALRELGVRTGHRAVRGRLAAARRRPGRSAWSSTS